MWTKTFYDTLFFCFLVVHLYLMVSVLHFDHLVGDEGSCLLCFVSQTII